MNNWRNNHKVLLHVKTQTDLKKKEQKWRIEMRQKKSDVVVDKQKLINMTKIAKARQKNGRQNFKRLSIIRRVATMNEKNSDFKLKSFKIVAKSRKITMLGLKS